MKIKLFSLLAAVSIVSCADYAWEHQGEILLFHSPLLKYEADSMVIPYALNKLELIVDPRKSSGTMLYKSKKPVPDSIFLNNKYRNKKQLANIYNFKIKGFQSRDGYIKLSDLKLSFSDTNVFRLDSACFNPACKENEGKIYLRIMNIGKSLLKTETNDTTFYITFINTGNSVIIKNNFFEKHWTEDLKH